MSDRKLTLYDIDQLKEDPYQFLKPRTPLASALGTIRSRLRWARRRWFFWICGKIGHDYWVELDAPVSGPLEYTCRRCDKVLIEYRDMSSRL